jgi:1-acyl-sn-glycerol-3-phosphate acyltransferase
MDAPHISKPLLRFFRRIVRGYFRRHFRAVRINGAERFKAAGADGRPLIVYANHASWWDPMVQVLLAGELMPGRSHYAPMDAEALEHYAILKRIGVFGIEMNTARGAAQFLRTGLRVLKQGGVMWVTPQGRFADARERPLAFKPGLAALAARVPGGCTVLPLAIEYTFWDERLPETLLHFGQAVTVEDDAAEAVQERLSWALMRAMDELKELAMMRDPGQFQVLRKGRMGTGGFYELGQRIWAAVHGRSYRAQHTAEAVRESE